MTLAVSVEAQLIVAGFTSGVGLATWAVRRVLASPEREQAAYHQGVTDESHRCAEDIAELRAVVTQQAAELTRMRNAMLSLVVAADLTEGQRSAIAKALGYSHGQAQQIPPPEAQ